MLVSPPRVPIALPAQGPVAARAGFPLIATLAPVVVSLGIWAITQSVFSLLFAVLGPVVALGGLVDARRRRRRDQRRERERMTATLERIADRIEGEHARERARRHDVAVALDPLVIGQRAAERWAREPVEAGVPVRLGSADLPSVIELSGDADEETSGRSDALARVRELGSRLPGAALLVDALDGIGLVGPEAAVAAVARGVALQLAASCSPATSRIAAPRDEGWTSQLPHELVAGPDREFRVVLGANRERAREALVAWGRGVAELPPGCGLILRAAGVDGPAFERDAGIGADRVLPTAVTRVAAAELARAIAASAEAHGVRSATASLPTGIRLDQLEPRTDGLAAAIGHDGTEPVVVDLVADGPHALIGGTTGSGKSELLVSWVLAMAAGRTPAELTFLLIDFKGGASFAPLEILPHVVAALSDLDARLTRRAIESLRAELLRRERVLAEYGARSIEQLPVGVLARLVIVVDEFAALVSDRPELHAVFADLAARGRSLGLHLVLCTQRPSGVMRDAVLANVTLRIALRMTDRADSVATLGTDAAARLVSEPRGRALLGDGVAAPRPFQVALAEPADIERLCAAPAGRVVIRPWLPPLPARLPLASLDPVEPGSGIPFGRVDLPGEQRQPVAVHRPGVHGHLLVLGAVGSGRSTVLHTLAAGADARLLPDDPADAWQAIQETLDGPRREASPTSKTRLLLIDDLDLLLGRFDPDIRHDVVELLNRLLREAPGRGLSLAATAQRLIGPSQSLAGAFGSRLLLRQATREEHVLAGGMGTDFDAELPPGAGIWRGAAVQVALPGDVPEPRPVEVRVPEVPLVTGSVLAMVSGHSRELAGRLRAAGIRAFELGGVPLPEILVSAGEVTALVGDPDAWQSDWTLLSGARREFPMVFERCDAADLRAVARLRAVPPPLGTREGECWLVLNGMLRRAVLRPGRR